LGHLAGGRRSASVVGLFAALVMSITPSALAAGGAGGGPQSFCFDDGLESECGFVTLTVNYQNVIERGGVVVFSCGVALPSDDPNFIGVSITRCYVTNTETGTQHDGLMAGNAGPTTATAGGSTTLEDSGDYDVCIEGLGLYLTGERPYGLCVSPILTF
jgi:hypothetical protein